MFFNIGPWIVGDNFCDELATNREVESWLWQFPLTPRISSFTKSFLKMDSNCLVLGLLLAPSADLIDAKNNSRWSCVQKE